MLPAVQKIVNGQPQMNTDKHRLRDVTISVCIRVYLWFKTYRVHQFTRNSNLSAQLLKPYVELLFHA